MFCFNAGYVEKREAFLVGIGLSEINLSKLLDVNKPILVRSETLHLPDPGCDLGFFSTPTPNELQSRVNAILDPEEKATNERIACINCQNQLFVFPLNGKREFYLIGLNAAVTYPLLRKGESVSMRARSLSGRLSLEVLIFWGLTEEMMEEGFYAAGLIRPGQKVSRVRLDEQ